MLLGLLAKTAPAGPPAAEETRRAAETAAAKVRRVLPRALAGQVGALLDVADLGAGDAAAPPEARVLLLVAVAARDRRPLEVVHVRDGRERERTLRPYGLVAHRGRWYVCGADSRSGEVRTFRLDRLRSVRPGEGTFAVPDAFDARAAVLAALRATPWRHRVSVLVGAEPSEVEARLPFGLGSVARAATADGSVGWARVELRVESLDWVPGLLAGLAAGLDADLVVEEPAELQQRVQALGRRLAGG